MRSMLFALCAAIPLAASLGAQNPSRGGSVLVTVVDTSPSVSVRPFEVFGYIPYKPNAFNILANAHTVQVAPGKFRIDSLPEDSLHVDIACHTVRSGTDAWRAHLRFFIPAGASIDTVVKVHHSGCDTRPLRSEHRIFTGFYTPGFESSSFAPCANDNWILPSDSLAWLPYPPHAWVTFDSSRQRTPLQVVGTPKIDSYGNPTYYVRYRGTMVGPGNYGHMGVSSFLFRVDSLLFMSGDIPESCKPVLWENDWRRPTKRPPLQHE